MRLLSLNLGRPPEAAPILPDVDILRHLNNQKWTTVSHLNFDDAMTNCAKYRLHRLRRRFLNRCRQRRLVRLPPRNLTMKPFLRRYLTLNAIKICRNISMITSFPRQQSYNVECAKLLDSQHFELYDSQFRNSCLLFSINTKVSFNY